MADKTVYVRTDSTAGGNGSEDRTDGDNRAYHCLEDALHANETNLVSTLDGILNIIISEGGTDDDHSVTLHNYVCDSSHYINIYTTAGARFQSGKYDSGRYEISKSSGWWPNGSTPFYITGDDVSLRLTGLQFAWKGTATGNMIYFDGNGTDMEIRVSKCICHGRHINDYLGFFWFETFYGKMYFWNNIFEEYGYYNHVYCSGIRCNSQPSATYYIYNNTFRDGYYALHASGGVYADAYAKNNIFSGMHADNAWWGGTVEEGASPSGYNYTDDDDPGYDNSPAIATDEVSYDIPFADETAGALDLRITAAMPCYDAHADGYLAFDDDIEGNTRSDGSWDAGAYQYQTIGGSVCWGHSSGVEEDNARRFSGNWTGTGEVQ